MTDLTRRLAQHVEEATPDQAPPFDAVVSRTQQRRRRRQTGWAAASVAVVVIGAAGIGSQLTGSDERHGTAVGPHPSMTSHPSSPSVETATPVPPEIKDNAPPPVQFLRGGATVNVAASSYCWTWHHDGVCADGWIEDKDLAGAGDREAVDFWFAAEGDYRFHATFSELGEDCPRRITAPVEQTGEHTYRLTPAGPAGDYRVDLFGRGEQGSASFSFSWKTPTDGAMPRPDAYMGLVSGAGDDLETYGLELSVSDLASTPQTASAAVTVTAANGRSMMIDTHREDSAQNCYAEGTVYFTGDEAQSRRVLELGPAPYTYDVMLTLDGETYAGQGVWPTDERASQPYVTLSFSPALPAYTGGGG